MTDSTRSETKTEAHQETDRLYRRVRALEIASISWDVVEVFVSITTGLIVGSLALFAFGLDSLVEIFASSTMLWHVNRRTLRSKKRALHLVAVAFLLLGIYLLTEATLNLVSGHRPEFSPVGTTFLVLTAFIMLGIGFAERSIGHRLQDRAVLAACHVQIIDGLLATGVVIALLANRFAGLWWADAVAAGGLGVACLFEFRETWREAGEVRPVDD